MPQYHFVIKIRVRAGWKSWRFTREQGLLKVTLLGTFQAEIKEQPLTRFRSDKVRALLAYLMIEHQRAHRRDSLAALLWTDASSSKALKNLRGTLYRLKSAFEQGDATYYEQLFDFSNRSVHALYDGHSNLVWADVVEMQKLFDACEAHTHDHIAFCDECLSRIETAVSLYNGELLPGFNLEDAELFDEWLLLKREQIHQQVQSGLDLLLAYYSQHDEFTKVRQYSQRQLELEPWHENAYRHLMLALAKSGQRSAALAQFEKCQQVLWDELGVEPSSDTVAVFEQIKEAEVDGWSQTAVSPLQDAPRHNLPSRSAPYFGRLKEQEELKTFLLDPNYRFVTLLGEGGVGKTSLSLKVGHDLVEAFRDGVWLVQLDALEMRSPDVDQDEQLEGEIITAVSQSLGLSLAGQISPKQQLLTYLRQKGLLLIFDNYEHVLAGAEIVGEILNYAPRVSILVTSREPLNYVSEFVYPVHGLTSPESGHMTDYLETPSVQLFADRAQRVARSFKLNEDSLPDIIQIIQLVDGNPLAIELAAASLRKRSLPALYADIKSSIDTLVSRQRDLPQRHRSMRGVFIDSWKMLSEQEQHILAQLAVFRGGFFYESAKKVTGVLPDELDLLAEKSLVKVQFLNDGQTRYALHELLRQFALENLGSGVDETNQKHSYTFLQFLAERDDALVGENPQLPASEITIDFENIRKGWQTAVSLKQIDYLVPAVYPLSTFFQLRGRYLEQVNLFEGAIEIFQSSKDLKNEAHTLLARLIAEKSRSLIRLGEYEEAKNAIEIGLEHAPQSSEASIEGRLRLFRGELLWRLSNYSEAVSELEFALKTAVDLDDFELEGFALFNLGIINDIQQEYTAAESYFEKALRIWIRTKNRRLEAYTNNSLGVIAFNLKELEKAQKLYEKALDIAILTDDVQGKGMLFNSLSNVATEKKDYQLSKNYLQKSLSIARKSGIKANEALAYYNLGKVSLLENDLFNALPYFEIAHRLYEKLNNAFWIKELEEEIRKIKLQILELPKE